MKSKKTGGIPLSVGYLKALGTRAKLLEGCDPSSLWGQQSAALAAELRRERAGQGIE